MFCRDFLYNPKNFLFYRVIGRQSSTFIKTIYIENKFCGNIYFYYLCRINLMSMEQVNHPQHYTTYDVETLDMMIRIWGIQETISFCKLNAFKYRMRAGHKDNAQQDIDKALWYENKMKELSSCNNE